ncbi:hypothetical protein K402DRAFT_329483 [Aulographum hederae CBS 113979]|uniref:Life-span regulatory factor-domain-containing protein n=1 Tax=Aulographum hederae CBS 113979 TaxID=1176131 RepID=A0A6G1H4A2_9PEZI|nr:hypothetical protein K402DRAFT_329483 [Aulographum hederae CBS 113979]
MATHHRSLSSQSKKSTHGRPPKPALLTKRGYSSTNLSSSKRNSRAREEPEPEDESMAASFLQYCAFCEKQIITPNNSVLYCSEACKRKDNTKVLSFSSYSPESPPMTPFANFTFDDIPHRDIVPQLSPTTSYSNRFSYSEASDEEHTFPTEDYKYGHGHTRSESEAARYLRQFQSPSSLSEESRRTPRPRYNRSSTSMANMSIAPSLSHTPNSSVSMSMPYTPSARPLPPRTQHSSSYTSKSVDLVTPFAPMPMASSESLTTLTGLKTPPMTRSTTDFTAMGEMQYEKKSSLPSLSPGHGSLKQLLSFGSHDGLPTPSTFQAI